MRSLHNELFYQGDLMREPWDRVAFGADARGTVEGMLTRYNRKSVTVITDDGHQWNVSPALLSRAAVPSAAKPRPARTWSA